MTGITVNVDRQALLRCGSTEITFDPPGRVSLRAGTSEPLASQEMPELADNSFVEAWCEQGRILFIGLEAKPLWIARPDGAELRVVANLDRLDLSDGYDPGGMHRVAFQPLPDGDTLVIWEPGLARITREDGLAWQRPFDEISARLHHLTSKDIWLVGEYQPFGFRLSDGTAIPS